MAFSSLLHELRVSARSRTVDALYPGMSESPPPSFKFSFLLFTVKFDTRGLSVLALCSASRTGARSPLAVLESLSPVLPASASTPSSAGARMSSDKRYAVVFSTIRSGGH